MLTLAEVFEALCGIRPANTDLPLREVSIDSRQVRSNTLFAALPGSQSNGHSYIGDAFHHGARLALIERDLSHLFPVIDLRRNSLPATITVPRIPFCLHVESVQAAIQTLAKVWRLKLNPHVIALVGAQDETAVFSMLGEMFSGRSRTNRILLPPATLTDINLALLKAEKPTDRILIDLRTSDPNMVKEVTAVAAPRVGLVASQHYASKQLLAGERALFESLPRSAFAVLESVGHSVSFPAAQTAAQSFTYGIDCQAHLWADEVESSGMDGIQFCIHYRNEVIHVKVPLLGHRSVHTALQAAAVGLCDGLTWHDIVVGLRRSLPELRLLTLPAHSGAIILDDSYSTSSESTLAALNLLERIDGRKVAVLGEIQDDTYLEDGSQMVGVRAAEVVQELVAVGEQAYPIAEAARRAGLTKQAVTWVKTTQEAIDHLHLHLRKNDVVLVKGAGEGLMHPIVSALGIAA